VPVHEISAEDILLTGPEAVRLPLNERLEATLDGVGACKLRIAEQVSAGARARFETPSAELREKIEDRLWALHEENNEFVARAMEAGTALTRIFEDAVTRGEITLEDMFDAEYVEIAGTNPLQYRTRILSWADAALPPFQEAFLAKDSRMAFCVAIDRNGYLPVHNRLYSHPQRPGDVAFNTANSRNRRIFNDPAGLAAGQNQRPYLIQSYARDMGGGNTVMMREIDVPIRVRGRHWGGYRTAYKL
jgi:methyl-accepting chemotaxis protein